MCQVAAEPQQHTHTPTSPFNRTPHNTICGIVQKLATRRSLRFDRETRASSRMASQSTSSKSNSSACLLFAVVARAWAEICRNRVGERLEEESHSLAQVASCSSARRRAFELDSNHLAAESPFRDTRSKRAQSHPIWLASFCQPPRAPSQQNEQNEQQEQKEWASVAFITHS